MSITSSIPIATIEPYSVPQPFREQRDADGRRISVTFESGQGPPAVPAGDCWLVALDGSGHSLHALAQAMRLATESGVNALDLVDVQPWLSKEAAEAELPRRGWAACVDACARLDAHRLGWRLHVLMGEPAARIIELAGTLDSRGIVIGARGLTTGQALLLGSVAQQVIHTFRGAVLVVRGPATPEENEPC